MTLEILFQITESSKIPVIVMLIYYQLIVNWLIIQAQHSLQVELCLKFVHVLDHHDYILLGGR